MTAKLAKRPTAELDTLATGIREAHEACERDAQSAVEWAIRCGELLAEAKASVKHGEWLPWLEANFPAGERTARNYMQLAANRQRVADLDTTSVREALAELAEPRATHDVASPDVYDKSNGVAQLPDPDDDAEEVDAEVVDEGYEDVPQSRPAPQSSPRGPASATTGTKSLQHQERLIASVAGRMEDIQMSIGEIDLTKAAEAMSKGDRTQCLQQLQKARTAVSRLIHALA